MSESANTGHGHVYPRPDRVVARCGGPALCDVCAKEEAAQKAAAEQPNDGPPPDGTLAATISTVMVLNPDFRHMKVEEIRRACYLIFDACRAHGIEPYDVEVADV